MKQCFVLIAFRYIFMKYKFYSSNVNSFIVTPLTIFFLFFIFNPTSIYSSSYIDDTHILLNEGWQYYLGDFIMTDETHHDDSLWVDIDSNLKPIERPPEITSAWLRIKIPSKQWQTPTIYFELIYGEVVYLYANDKVIFNIFNSSSGSDMSSFIAPLTEKSYEQYLYLHIQSERYPRFGLSKNVYIGEYQNISSLFLEKGYIDEIIGFSFIFMAIVLLIITFLVVGKNRKVILSLCPLLISIGLVFIVIFSGFIHKYPNYKDILDNYSILIISSLVSITLFFRQIFGSGYKKIISTSLKTSILLVFLAYFGDISGLYTVSYKLFIFVFGMWSIISMGILIVTALYNSYKGNVDAKIFVIGFSIFAGILISEMLIFFISSDKYNFFAFKWGIIVFILSQIIILGRKITSYHNKTIAYSKELEKKNLDLDIMWKEVKKSRDSLAQLNKTLEQKVFERTCQLEKANTELLSLNEELHASNEELSDTLQMLKNTQDQLVKSEKMAALGQLVSCIAHELNTPLGAIQASVSNIIENINTNLDMLSSFLSNITPEKKYLLFKLINDSNCSINLSTKEEREHRRALLKDLNALGIRNIRKVAEQFSTLCIFNYSEYIHIFKNPDMHVLIEIAYMITCLKNSVHTISVAAEKTNKVVFALRTYAYPSTSSQFVETDIIQTIETVLTIYSNKTNQGVHVIKNYEKIPKVLCNPDEITQVWTNIIQNGLQAMDYKGTLELSTSVKDNYVVVSVTDSGEGIPYDMKDKIFQPFFTTKPLGEGTGLGLDIVSRIIDNHNGKIEVSSSPGKTTFSVFIPTKAVRASREHESSQT
ncbi:UNVERIFIED_CONTAM: Signal transduction histidine kinase, nitrogen specific [Acetivibrio alkalicellulosi]